MRIDHNEIYEKELERCGETRNKTRFLLFPKNIDGVTKWLEVATWEEIWSNIFRILCARCIRVIYILLYLTAIILANLSSAHFGPSASIVNAFLFIGLDLTSRDKLHEAWQGRGFIWKMGLLIATGSLISWAINRNAGTIAIASFVSFASAALVDTIIYQILHKKDYLVKVNESNVFSALTDSLIFPTIAFGGFMPLVTLGQFLAKVAGGFIWALILSNKKE